ncbi:deoxyribonuclease-1-like [Notothenia coriiceps]|uniref:Deoxyribonuclease-1-like n=1 Tax=Notothenia coriiceps TaxID=8208 RepID=A0A6I9PJC5_9TELE|nr:PREDICTED: deoxyribonuclease-1-like [Notothenia coriiceps]
MDLVNQGSHQFSYIVSEPLPLGSSILQLLIHKERYLFLYRDQKVSVKGSFQYTGTGFNRPPFVVQFSSTETAVKEFVLIPIHTKSGSAVKEIDALVDVVKKAKLKWTNNNIMVLGDFNADGKHVKAGDLNKIRLLDNNKYFHWLIANGVDTTLEEKSSNTYDRIVVTTEMEKGVVAGSAKVFNFREEYDLRDKAKKVSDHFPVEVRLKLQVEPEAEAPEAEAPDTVDTADTADTEPES